LSTIEVIPLGALDGSGGYSFSVRRDGAPTVLLDAGRGATRPDWIGEGAAHDIVWVSHGHTDHAGALPDLLAERPQMDVVLPAAAARFAAAVAVASGVDASRAHAIYDNAHKPKFHETFDCSGFSATCGPSGHGSGAALLRVETPIGAIGYTGDWALHPRAGAPPANLELLRDLELLVCECALAGAKRLDDWSHMQTISDLFHYFDHEGPRLAAVSAFGEFEELVALLRNRDDLMVESGLEGLADEAPFGDRAACAAHLRDGGLVVAHGPHMSASEPAGELAIPHVTGPKARIALFNAVPRGSDAATLLWAKRRQRRTIYGENRRIRAHVRRFDFPSHATRPDLIRAITMLAPRALLLFHQSETVRANLQHALREAGFRGAFVDHFTA
jgi:Cft2 family RNA processing exonuclease